MVSSPSVLAAATALAEWARERRAGWSDVPLGIPRAAQTVLDAAPAPIAADPGVLEPPVLEPVILEPAVVALIATEPIVAEPILAEPIVAVSIVPEPIVHELLAHTADDVVDDVVHVIDDVVEPQARTLPSVGAVAAAGARTCARALGRRLYGAVEWLASLGQPAAEWLLRTAAVVSLMSVVMFAAVNRGQFLDRWDRVTAAMRRPEASSPTPAGLPAGTGRLTIATSEGSAQVLIDGTSRGPAPLTVDLPAGAHRVLLRSPNGSVERAVRVRAGESSDMTESIFPGWIALVTSIDVTMSEGGQPLKRDERGWAILPPGPHDILLDNRTLGVHELRHVVVTPGDTTRLSFMPHASAISLTANEVADVWIDGASFGQTPLVDQPIAVGVHDIRVRSALHERWVRVRATVQPIQINVDLTAQ